MSEVISTIALTSEFIGTLLIGIAVLRVHMHVRKEHKIDGKVLKAIGREQWLTKSGLVFILIGFVINLTGMNLS